MTVSPLVSLTFDDVFPARQIDTRVLRIAVAEPRLLRIALMTKHERRAIHGIGPKIDAAIAKRLSDFDIPSRAFEQSVQDYMMGMFEDASTLPIVSILTYAQWHGIDQYGNACLQIVVEALRDTLQGATTLTDLTICTKQELYELALDRVLNDSEDVYAADFVKHGIRALDDTLYVGWEMRLADTSERTPNLESLATPVGA